MRDTKVEKAVLNKRVVALFLAAEDGDTQKMRDYLTIDSDAKSELPALFKGEKEAGRFFCEVFRLGLESGYANMLAFLLSDENSYKEKMLGDIESHTLFSSVALEDKEKVLTVIFTLILSDETQSNFFRLFEKDKNAFVVFSSWMISTIMGEMPQVARLLLRKTSFNSPPLFRQALRLLSLPPYRDEALSQQLKEKLKQNQNTSVGLFSEDSGDEADNESSPPSSPHC